MAPISPHKEIRRLRDELRASRQREAGLEAQLLARGVRPVQISAWMEGLRPQGVALVMALAAVHPGGLDVYALNDVVPRQDHAADRDPKIVNVIIHHVRTELGKDVIEAVWGRGYRLSDEMAARVQAPVPSADPTDNQFPGVLGR